MSRVNRNRTNILRRAAICSLYAMPLYAEGEGDKGGGAGDKPPKKEDGPKKIELTREELEQQKQAAIDEALEKDRKKREKDEQDANEERERQKLEDDGKLQELADKAEAKRVAAEEKAAAAERRAQLAEVGVSLRDHLNAEHPEYATNAPDIMLHVEKKLAADAKPEDVAKLIKDESAAFVERTGKVKKRGLPPEAPPRTPVRQPANPNRPNPNARTTRSVAQTRF